MINWLYPKPAKIFLALALTGQGLTACGESLTEPEFVHLAEGFTSKDEHTGIVAAHRMFSAPDLADICARLESPAGLVAVATEPVRLERDRWFSYDRLVVIAVDSSGRLLPPAPIEINVENVAPEILNLSSEMTASPNGKVLPIRAGSFRFRLATICDSHSATVSVAAEVLDP